MSNPSSTTGTSGASADDPMASTNTTIAPSSSLRAARAAGVAAIRLRKQQSGSFLDRGAAADDGTTNGVNSSGPSSPVPPSAASSTNGENKDNLPSNGGHSNGTMLFTNIGTARLPTDGGNGVDEAEADLRMTERMAALSRLVLTNARIRGQHALKLSNLTSRLSLAPSQLPAALLPVPQSSPTSTNTVVSGNGDERDGERSAAEEDDDGEDIEDVSDEISHLTTELAKAYKLLAEREEDLRLAAQIGQMTVAENARLEEAMAQVTSHLQQELEQTAMMEKKNSSLRAQVEELNKQNLDLVRDSMKGNRKPDSTESATATAIEDSTEFLKRELGADYTGDTIMDICALKRHIGQERRRKNAECDGYEDHITQLEADKAEAQTETKNVLKQLDALRVHAERTDKALSDLQTVMVDKDIEIMAARREQMAHAARANAAVIETLEQELATEREARIHAEQLLLELEMERAQAEPVSTVAPTTNVEVEQQQPELSPRAESVDSITPLRGATTPDHTPAFGRGWAAQRNSILLLSTDRMVDNGLTAPMTPTSANSSGQVTPQQLSPRASQSTGPNGTPLQSTPLQTIASPRPAPPTILRRPSAYSPASVIPIHRAPSGSPQPTATTSGSPPTPGSSTGVVTMFSPGDAALSAVVSQPASSPNNNLLPPAGNSNGNSGMATPSLQGILSTSRLEQLRSISGHRRGRSGLRSRRSTASGAALLSVEPTTPGASSSVSSSRPPGLPRSHSIMSTSSNSPSSSPVVTFADSVVDHSSSTPTIVTITAPNTPGSQNGQYQLNLATPPPVSSLSKSNSLSVTPSYATTGATLAAPGSGPSPTQRHVRGTSFGASGSGGGGMYAQLLRLEDDVKRLKSELRAMEAAKIKAETALADAKAIPVSPVRPATTPSPTADDTVKPVVITVEEMQVVRDQLQRVEVDLKTANDRIVALTSELTSTRNELTSARVAEQRADDAEHQASEVARKALLDTKQAQELLKVSQQQVTEGLSKIRNLETAAGTRAAEIAELTRQLVLLRAAAAAEKPQPYHAQSQSATISDAISPTISSPSRMVTEEIMSPVAILSPSTTHKPRLSTASPLALQPRQSATMPAVTLPPSPGSVMMSISHGGDDELKTQSTSHMVLSPTKLENTPSRMRQSTLSAVTVSDNDAPSSIVMIDDNATTTTGNGDMIVTKLTDDRHHDLKRLRAFEASLARREAALVAREREVEQSFASNERITKAEVELQQALEETRRANIKARELEERLRGILAKAKGMTHSPIIQSQLPPPGSSIQMMTLSSSTHHGGSYRERSSSGTSAAAPATMAAPSSSSNSLSTPLLSSSSGSSSSSSSGSGSSAAPAEPRRAVCSRTSCLSWWS